MTCRAKVAMKRDKNDSKEQIEKNPMNIKVPTNEYDDENQNTLKSLRNPYSKNYASLEITPPNDYNMIVSLKRNNLPVRLPQTKIDIFDSDISDDEEYSPMIPVRVPQAEHISSIRRIPSLEPKMGDQRNKLSFPSLKRTSEKTPEKSYSYMRFKRDLTSKRRRIRDQSTDLNMTPQKPISINVQLAGTSQISDLENRKKNREVIFHSPHKSVANRQHIRKPLEYFNLRIINKSVCTQSDLLRRRQVSAERFKLKKYYVKKNNQRKLEIIENSPKLKKLEINFKNLSEVKKFEDISQKINLSSFKFKQQIDKRKLIFDKDELFNPKYHRKPAPKNSQMNIKENTMKSPTRRSKQMIKNINLLLKDHSQNTLSKIIKKHPSSLIARNRLKARSKSSLNSLNLY
ncbi:unnamed protein product [Moneuplotes crassus]|uniref:Uncharacterized protein n=1 Tax=Euplotes crassus TaxID=5936 RepID=A0AAD1UD43_EUPCR|nr:unnamed protein product [Moneuplotes crassus]